jgi:hypothetical protein
MQLTKEDVDAINRLLTWRTETLLEGIEATVELRTWHRTSTNEHLFAVTAARGSHDEIHLYAYEPTIPAAVDSVLARMAEAVDELTGERDTQPTNPRPSSMPPVLAPAPAEAVTDWSDVNG